MRRLVGKGRKKVPAKTIETAYKTADECVNENDYKVEELNEKIRLLKLEINNLPKDSPAREERMSEAKILLKKKKMFENQSRIAKNDKSNLHMQQFNVSGMYLGSNSSFLKQKNMKKFVQNQKSKIKKDKDVLIEQKDLKI